MNLAPYLDDALDEDAFLPTSGEGLANIFVDSKKEKVTNQTLKFVPPKPSAVIKSKETCDMQDEQITPSKRSSECLLGKAIQAHELVNGAYEARGKLGLAIMKIQSPACTTLVIFNGAKVSLSSVMLTEKFEVTVQNGNYITYYDESLKNWSLLLSNKDDVTEVVEILRKYDVKIYDKSTQLSSERDKSELGTKESSARFDTQKSENDKSSKNSKPSVISRIAKVGHAIILPPTALSDQSGDTSADESSSQRNEALLPPKKAPKYTKRSETQRSLIESSDSSCQAVEKVQISSIVPVNAHANSSHSSNIYLNDHLVPASKNDFSNLNVFLSETRINNTEVRMNVNRISDKVDKVLEHVMSLETTRPHPCSSFDFSSSFTTEIYQKLLREYEDKIKMKESVITTLQGQLQKLESSNLKSSVTITEIPEVNCEELRNKSEMISSENSVLKSEVEDLKSSLALKIKEAENLLSTTKELENQCIAMEETCEKLCNLEEDNKSLTCKVLALEQKLSSVEIKNCCENKETSTELYQCQDACTQCQSEEMSSELKKIMNSIFRELATQFEDNQAYTGAVVCTVIASVMKKTTLDALSNINK